MSNFQPFEFVGRGSETQLQVCARDERRDEESEIILTV